MARFVQFECIEVEEAHKVVFINPEHVIAVSAMHNTSGSMITTVRGLEFVAGNIWEVTEKLQSVE